MKAARWHGVKDIRVEDIDTPEPGPGEVAIKVAWTGICGSDLHEYLAGPIFVPVGQDHPLSHDKAPITMGHEYCGTVSRLGTGVEGLAIGDRVAIEPIFACGTCPACLEGKYNLCDSLGFVGLSEAPRVYRRVKLSKDEPHEPEEIYPRLSCRTSRSRRSAFPRPS